MQLYKLHLFRDHISTLHERWMVTEAFQMMFSFLCLQVGIVMCSMHNIIV